MDFQARKAAILQDLASPLRDKSIKGNVDARIAPLIARINAHPAFFTTSSCSGRISVSTSATSSPSQELEDSVEEEDDGSGVQHQHHLAHTTTKRKKKKKGGDWSFVTHHQADAEEVVRTIRASCDCKKREGQSQQQLLIFRFEPFILAVECLNLPAAQHFVSCAISSGFRESGITSLSRRIIAAVRSSIRIEAPVAEGGHMMVDEEYLRLLVRLGNEKLAINHQKTDQFLLEFNRQVEAPYASIGEPVKRRLPKNSVCVETACSSEKRKSKTKNCARKLTDLEKRQFRVLSRILEMEAKIQGWDPNTSVVNGLNCAEEVIQKETEIVRDSQGLHLICDTDIEVATGLEKQCTSCLNSVLGIAGRESEKECFLTDVEAKGEIFVRLRTTGEGLYRWGHSTCLLPCMLGRSASSVLVFGGYGGSLKQCRQNDLVLFDCENGKLQTLSVENPPTARLGHTASIIGRKMAVIGGREDPSKFLGDVCVFRLEKMQWSYPKVRGACFPPRHRHAAVTFEEKIYVFGGLGNLGALGDLHVLNMAVLEWSEIECSGSAPAPRHSHSISAIDQKIYLFGGLNGNTVFGDLWVLDLESSKWSQINCNPLYRFSHSLTVCNRSLLLLGGCPLTKEANTASIFNVDTMEWRHGVADLPQECMFVRHTATCIGDHVVIIGGGVSCFAFGIKFSPLFLMDLTCLQPYMLFKGRKCVKCVDKKCLKDVNASFDVAWGVRTNKAHARWVKDSLKQLGWLDSRRKVRVDKDEMHIIFPVTEEAVNCLQANNAQAVHFRGGFADEQQVIDNGFAKSTSIEIVQMELFGGLKTIKDPREILQSSIGLLIQREGLPTSLLFEVPKRWERLDNMAVLPATSFGSEAWQLVGPQLWRTVAECLNVHRVARQARVEATETRDSNLVLLLGENAWVHHRENGIVYCFDAAKCMFSSGNISEKLRMAQLNCTGETIVDMFAGIGYFVLPFLLRANAKKVYACEWNPHALNALRYNLRVNKAEDRCVVLEGDNREFSFEGVADRVCLGLLPSSEESWGVAVKALRSEGGILHIHGNATDTGEFQWVDYVRTSIIDISKSQGRDWDIQVKHVERVKWYAPHIRHLVVDVECWSNSLQM